MKIYYEKDVNMDVLKDKTVAVIGYEAKEWPNPETWPTVG
jgi:ketol-acid reductoisomerase